MIWLHSGHQHTIRYIKSHSPISWGTHGPADTTEQVAWCCLIVGFCLVLRITWSVFR